MKLDAVLWDYDGTLVNSVPKNISITKTILSIVAPHLTGDNLPEHLQSESAYHEANHAAENWQDLYVNYYGMTQEEMLQAGSMWAEHQEKNQTPVRLFEGITSIIQQFSHLSHGICSQNSQRNIRNVLQLNGIESPFKAVIGYDDVLSDHQKPAPYGGIQCLETMFGHTNSQLIMYIGDHEADTQFARNLQSALGSCARVISVAAAYSHSEPDNWEHKPDYVALHVEDLLSIIGKYT
ncbi:HAD family hydrolase [Endozoicomonas atrinae]|uniref:HAD family hydrolase n=1 Tax=Endozoicomonas atrinae TaxID=1333660 RepID=UPI0008265C41|nr:HAD family hydrolase [Endozoicomonas atrinae]